MKLTGIDTFYSLYLHIMQQYPDLDTIEAFVALADAGSFALAGQRVGRDPTIISRRVQALEARLGVRLAERSTRRVTLTEAGRAYLERLRPLLRELAAADREASAFAEGAPRGNLRLSLPTSFGRMWLSPLIAEFLKAHPQVTIEAELSNRFVDIIGEQFDLAVRLGVLPDSRLVARRLFPRYRLLCASPDYLATAGPLRNPSDLVQHNCLRFTGKVNPAVWEFFDADGKILTVPVTGAFASDDGEVLVDSAVAGLGLLYSSDWLVARQLASGQLVRVLADWRIPDEGAIQIVTPSLAGLPSKTRAFSDWLTRRFRPDPPWAAAQLR